MQDIKLALITGIDIPIPELQLTLHQPTMEEIAFVGQKNFLLGIQCLCIDKNNQGIKDKSLLDTIDNFQIFMRLMSDSEAVDKKNTVLDVMTLLFPEHTFQFVGNRSLIFQNKKTQELTMVDGQNFEILQEILKIAFCFSKTSGGFNTTCDEADVIAKKLERARERVAAQNGNQSDDIFGQYLSVLSVGLHLSLKERNKLTMFILFDMVERYTLYTSWDLNIRSRMAGAKIDSQPENWMKPIH